MTKDFITATICKGIRDTFKVISKEEKYAKDRVLLNTLTPKEELELIELVVDVQALCIRKAIESKEDIKIDYIGSFKVSELREYYLNFRKQVLTDEPEINDSDMEVLRKEAIQKFYSKKLKFDKSVVNRLNKNS